VSVRAVIVALGLAALAAAPAAGGGASRNGLIAIATVARSGGVQIRLLTPDLKPRRVVAVEPSVDLPRFSPDGRRLAFWAGPDPDRSVPWVAEADGAGARPLVPVPSGREPTTEYWGPPVWGPNSRTLAYVDDDHSSTGSTSFFSTIHIIGADGRGDRVVSITGWRGSTPPSSFALVAWRGGRMLVKANASGREFVLDFRRRRVTLLPGDDGLSPDGRRVACTDAGKLSIIELSTQKRRELAAVTSVRDAPTWSRDGSMLAVRTSHGVEIVALNHSTAPRLIRAAPTNLAWSPDGQYLLTDRPAVVALRSRAVMLVPHLSPSRDYGSPVDWQSR
jgi:Tol biopolymer transport system component